MLEIVSRVVEIIFQWEPDAAIVPFSEPQKPAKAFGRKCEPLPLFRQTDGSRHSRLIISISGQLVILGRPWNLINGVNSDFSADFHNVQRRRQIRMSAVYAILYIFMSCSKGIWNPNRCLACNVMRHLHTHICQSATLKRFSRLQSVQSDPYYYCKEFCLSRRNNRENEFLWKWRKSAANFSSGAEANAETI